MPTILITGANRGLGLEFALHRLELTAPDQVLALANALAGEAIDVLINNAGIAANEKTSLGDMNYAAWEHMMRVNVMGPLRVAEAFVPHLSRSSRRVMLFLSSRAGSITDNLSGGRYIYRSSKAALNAVVKSLAIDLQPQRMICVAVHPGWVRTDMGGAGAPIDTVASVTALRVLVERLEPHHNGHFLNYDGQELRW